MRDATILVVDDDAMIRAFLRDCLEAEGFAVVEADGRAAAEAELRAGPVSLVTLDLGLGEENGLDLARDLTREHRVPIIMVTGRSDVIDRVVGLELGADDYIVKPFHPREMVARVRMVLRRAGRAAAAEPTVPVPPLYEFAGMKADPARLDLWNAEGVRIELTAGDFRLLEVFLDAPGRTLSRDAILDRLHGRGWAPCDRSIDNQVARLRKKIEKDPANPEVIKTVRGVGYLMAAPVRRA